MVYKNLTDEKKTIHREFLRLYRLAFPEIYRASSKKWRLKNAEYNKERQRLWYEKNKSRRTEWNRKWRQAHSDLVNSRVRKRRADNPQRFRSYDKKCQAIKTISNRERRHANVNIRIAGAHRGRIWASLRGKAKYRSSRELLGCSIDDFKIYLETKFEPGMSWENYGRNGWHVDHIMPCAIFDLSKPDHQKRCFHFSNMQPMWAVQNHSKGAKILHA